MPYRLALRLLGQDSATPGDRVTIEPGRDSATAAARPDRTLDGPATFRAGRQRDGLAVELPATGQRNRGGVKRGVAVGRA